mgnify:CR=1 FL=1
MRVAGIVQDSIVDGPGFRFTLFTQGCPHGCKGCHNPQTHDYNGGTEMTTEEIVKKLLSNPLTDGITFSGGEPFEQAAACAEVDATAREHGLNVWAYSGYTFEKLIEKSQTDEGIKRLLSLTDVVVDGPFILEEKSYNVPWRGSKNQRLINVPESLKTGKTVIMEA